MFLPCLGRFGKTAFNHAGREYRAATNGGETVGDWQGRNVCRLKGEWLLQAPCPVHTARQSRVGKENATHRYRFPENQVARQKDWQEKGKIPGWLGQNRWETRLHLCAASSFTRKKGMSILHERTTMEQKRLNLYLIDMKYG